MPRKLWLEFAGAIQLLGCLVVQKPIDFIGRNRLQEKMRNNSGIAKIRRIFFNRISLPRSTLHTTGPECILGRTASFKIFLAAEI
jgi:hypothetical protein